MANPWNGLPFPDRADADDNATFAGVGRVLTAWELVEFALGTIYGILRDDGTLNSVLEYGTLGEVFSRRYPRLKIEADSFFARYPNRPIERQFYKLLERTIGYSIRRNEVAHGLVVAVQQMSYFKVRLGLLPPQSNLWLLVPPVYALGKTIGTEAPTYAYSSVELNALAKNLHDLNTDLQSFRNLLQRDALSEDL